jgi:hypothetical protein
VSLRALAGWRWVENPGHIDGARDNSGYGALEVMLTR